MVNSEEKKETEEKKWSEMTGMQKFMYVLRILLGFLGLAAMFSAGWAARGAKDKGIREKAQKYDDLQASKRMSSSQPIQQRPGMQSKTSTSSFTGGVPNRSADQLL